jgi:hypothetical protein
MGLLARVPKILYHYGKNEEFKPGTYYCRNAFGLLRG